MNLTVVLAIGTCIVGAALVTAAFVGRAHTLILVGLVLLTATAVSNSIDVPLRGGIGSRHYHPLTLSELQSEYRLGIGELQLDLRDLPLAGRDAIRRRAGGHRTLVGVGPELGARRSARARRRGFGGAVRAPGRRLAAGRTAHRRRNRSRASCASTCAWAPGQVEVRRFEPDGSETLLRGN